MPKIHISTFYYDNKDSDSKIKRDNLIWKLKCRKANINKAITLVLTAISSIVLFFLLLLVTLVASNPIILIGIAFFQVNATIAIYYTFDDIFESDSYFIKVKHKNKYYE